MAEIRSFAQYAGRMLRSQRADSRAMIDASIAHASQNPRPAGSGIQKLLLWLEEHPNGGFYKLVVFDEGIDHSLRLLNTIDQHARTVELMLCNDAVEGATLMTICRAALEATAQICYLHDAAIPIESLAARNIAARLAFFQGNETTSIAFGEHLPSGKAEDVVSAVDGIQDFLRTNGVVLDEGRPPRKFANWVQVGESARANVRFNATDAITHYVGGRWQYVIGSGATHALGWLLPSYVSGIEEKLGDDEDIILSAVGGLLDCGDALARLAQAHSGFDTVPVRRKTLTRRSVLVANARGEEPSPIDLETYERRGLNWTATEVPRTHGAAFGFRVRK